MIMSITMTIDYHGYGVATVTLTIINAGIKTDISMSDFHVNIIVTYQITIRLLLVLLLLLLLMLGFFRTNIGTNITSGITIFAVAAIIAKS